MKLLFGVLKEEDRNIKIMNRWEPTWDENADAEYGAVILVSANPIDIEEIDLTISGVEETIRKTKFQVLPDELLQFGKEINEKYRYIAKQILKKEQFQKESAIEISIQKEECKPLYVHVVL